MSEIITYSNPFEAWFWTHLEISIPVTLLIVIAVAINWHQKWRD